MTPIQIPMPPIEIWKADPIKKWCWRAPNGANGTHEGNARAAAVTALNSMRVNPSAVNLDDLPIETKETK